jgi:hypothetical protein
MKSIVLARRGTLEGGSQDQTIETPPYSRLLCDGLGNYRAIPLWTALSVFELLPAASAAAGNDSLVLSLGTSTEVIARAAKGGVNVKTQASTPADNNNAMLIPVASSGLIVPITAVSRPRFSTRVNLTQITELTFGAGFDENLTSPQSQATAGEGAGFLFDPLEEITTGLTTAQHANWILTEKVNGTDTYVATTIPVLAGRDYDLQVQIGEDLKPVYYIDGVNVGTGASALTSGDSVGVVIGVQINANPPAGQKDFDCRYVAVERFIG